MKNFVKLGVFIMQKYSFPPCMVVHTSTTLQPGKKYVWREGQKHYAKCRYTGLGVNEVTTLSFWPPDYKEDLTRWFGYNNLEYTLSLRL